MMWRREDYPLLPLCCAQAEESETADCILKSQRKGRGDKMEDALFCKEETLCFYCPHLLQAVIN